MDSTCGGFIPAIDPTFQPFGVYGVLERAVTHPEFLAVYVAGEAGNGKTHAIMQAHARAQRPLLRVNVSEQSDESLLIHTGLVNGDTVDRLGPVALAARNGWSVLLDEFDCGGPLLMTLQAVLEGRPFTLPRTGERIEPAPGFKLFATGNTLGRGSDRYVHTRPVNEATLDRFSFVLVQYYPNPVVEARILAAKLGDQLPDDLRELPETLARWAGAIRDAHRAGLVDDTMTTRRLVHLVQSLPVFQWNVREAMSATTARFGPVTSDAMARLWTDVMQPSVDDVYAASAVGAPAPRASASGVTAPLRPPQFAAFGNGASLGA